MKHARTASETSTRAQTSVTLSYLLKVLNPNSLGYICLDDMKHVLERVPEACRRRVEKLFHGYIFTFHSFKLPISQFVKLYESEAPHKASPERAMSRAAANTHAEPSKAVPIRSDTCPVELRRRLKNLSQERQFITYDTTFRDLANTCQQTAPPSSRTPLVSEKRHKRVTSDAVEVTGKSGSYSGLHRQRVFMRKEREWEDIKVAQALAISKARTKSPVTLETELDGTMNSRPKTPTQISATDETSKLSTTLQDSDSSVLAKRGSTNCT